MGCVENDSKVYFFLQNSYHSKTVTFTIFATAVEEYGTLGKKHTIKPINLLWIDSPKLVTGVKSTLVCYGLLDTNIQAGAAASVAARDPATNICRLGKLRKRHQETVNANATLTAGNTQD